MPSDTEYPKLDKTKVYLVSGGEFNLIMNLLKRSRPQATQGGGVQIDQETESGTYLSVLGAQGGIPNPPNNGTYVLGSVDANIQWLATNTCN